jgi:hypothetical protein
VAVLVVWVQHVRLVGHWLQVHTGTVNEPGPYYGFWSGFGSDLEEFGILGAIAAGIYSLVRKFNCHEPGCWRLGNHPAAGGQFNLCYRHHPDFQGRKPTHELIERLHREHVERQAAIHSKLQEIHQHLTATPAAAPDVPGPGPPTTPRQPETTTPSRPRRHHVTSPSTRKAAGQRWPARVYLTNGVSGGWVSRSRRPGTGRRR